MNRAIPVSAALILASTNVFAWGDGCDYRAGRNLDIEAKDLASFELLARAGDLEITGDPNQSTIEIRGNACTSEESLLPQIKLVQRREGDRQIVEVVMPDVSGGWWSEQASLDLVVRLPARLLLKLQDSSGDTQVSGVAALDATDSSGDFEARDIAGNARLQDSSGDLSLQGIGGSVTIANDSSGDVSISDVQRDAIVEVDSSGNLLLRNIRGNASVTHDSSGDITFDHIGGNALVGSDSSGNINAYDIAMAFTVGSDTSGDIDHRNVQGKVTVPLD
jgi:hypothetical protein